MPAKVKAFQMRRKVGRPRNKPPSPKKKEVVEDSDDEDASSTSEEENDATKSAVALADWRWLRSNWL